MPHSYSSIWIHVIWSTKNREPILNPQLKNEVIQVLQRIAKEHEINIDCVNGIEDHLHFLLRLSTDQSVADVVKTLKGNSWEHFRNTDANYISWQDGFAAFSVSADKVYAVRKYIHNQVIHHRAKSFSDELKMIKDEIRGHEQ